jgi:O-methyltransferase
METPIVIKIRSRVAGIVKRTYAKSGVIVAKFDSKDRRTLLGHWLELNAQGRLLQSPADACQLVNALRATGQVAGDIAEVGTAGGGSARLITEYSGEKTVHLFDTFEGLPKPGALDNRFREGSYRWDLSDVQQYLNGRRVEFHKGMFPASAASVQNLRFSFVHLDVDLYQSTLDSLKFFYPRMSAGGIIITHDYAWDAGVDQAFAEFFSDKPETPIELIGHQAMVVKLS